MTNGGIRKELERREMMEFIGCRRVVTMQELKAESGLSESTIRRLLKGRVVTSINRNRRYETTKGILNANSDEHGLWRAPNRVGGALFSRHEGDIEILLRTLIWTSDAGMTEKELRESLSGMFTQKHLHEMYLRGMVERERFSHKYVYLARNPRVRKAQRERRGELEPPCKVSICWEDLCAAYGRVQGLLTQIIRETLKDMEIEDGRIGNAELLTDIFTRLFWGGGVNSDRQHGRRSSADSRLDALVSAGKSKISDLKLRFGVFGCKRLFQRLTKEFLQRAEVTEGDAAFDCSHFFKSENTKWGLKVHAAGLAPYGVALGITICSKGTEDDMATFPEVYGQVMSYGITVRHVLGDGAYDDWQFYYYVHKNGGVPVCRYNPRRSKFKIPPGHDSIVRHLVEQKEEHIRLKELERERRRLRRRGRRRKNFPDKHPDVFDPQTMGTLLRKHQDIHYGSHAWHEIYRKRTLIERIFSILKCQMGLGAYKTSSKEARHFAIYAAFIAMQVVALIAVEVGVPKAALRLSILK